MLDRFFIKQGGLADSGGWLATLSSGYYAASTDGIVVDDSLNVYICGVLYVDSTAYNNSDLTAYLAKFSPTGALLWQRGMGTTAAGNEQFRDLTLDSTGNIYVTGVMQVSGSNKIVVAKYNTSGTIQWQEYLTLSSSASNTGYGITLDSSNNIIIIANSGGSRCTVIKLNSSGSPLWAYDFAEQLFIDKITVDSSNNIYLVTRNGTFGNEDIVIMKMDTNGSVLWQRTIGGTGTDSVSDIAVDSTGVYIVGYMSSQGAGGNDILIVKYDTSGTIQWQRSLGGTRSDVSGSICTDGTGNVFITGSTNISAGDDDIIIARYDSSGNIQWQRSISGTVGYTQNGTAIAAKANSIFVGGKGITTADGSGQQFLIVKLPKDGSRTGTYAGYTYATKTLTDAARTLTTGTPAISPAAVTISATASSFPTPTVSLTAAVTTI